MKFEFSHAQEESSYYSRISVDSKTTDVFRECLESFSLLTRERHTWNTATFVVPGYDRSTSVCTVFTIASKHLYSDEMAHFSNHLSRYLATIRWPDLETIDRHYFIQCLDGVIRCALPNCFGLTVLNETDFYLGNSSPVIELSVGALRFWRKRRCRE